MTRFSTPPVSKLAITLVLAAGIFAFACSRAANTVQEAAPATPAAATTQVAEEPKYEPAYPAEVSTEALTEKDVDQQAKPHTHGDGKPHSHGEKDKDDHHVHPN